jgi:hypothetical protein
VGTGEMAILKAPKLVNLEESWMGIDEKINITVRVNTQWQTLWRIVIAINSGL